MTNNITFKFLKSNILGFVIGLGLLHPLIAHGLTGDHEHYLSLSQLAMHIIALLFFSTVYYWQTQKVISENNMSATYDRLSFLWIVPQCFFWLGYYTLDIPFDILFMSISIALINAFSLQNNFIKKIRWIIFNVVFVLVGFTLAALVTYPLYDWVMAQKITGLKSDFMIWLSISFCISSVYGSLTGWYISRYAMVIEEGRMSEIIIEKTNL